MNGDDRLYDLLVQTLDHLHNELQPLSQELVSLRSDLEVLKGRVEGLCAAITNGSDGQPPMKVSVPLLLRRVDDLECWRNEERLANRQVVRSQTALILFSLFLDALLLMLLVSFFWR